MVAIVRVIPSDFETEVTPADLVDAPSLVSAMFGTFVDFNGNGYDYDGAANDLLYSSFREKRWVGIVYDPKSVPFCPPFILKLEEMVENELVIKKKLEDGLLYELTKSAIEKAFIRQSRRQSEFRRRDFEEMDRLREEIKRLRRLTFWEYIKFQFSKSRKEVL
jgi:hypothetical protein